MKINYKEITVTGGNQFTFNGCAWFATRFGTSARGLWTEFTNGEKFIRVYKKDLLKVDKEAAVKLFN